MELCQFLRQEVKILLRRAREDSTDLSSRRGLSIVVHWRGGTSKVIISLWKCSKNASNSPGSVSLGRTSPFRSSHLQSAFFICLLVSKCRHHCQLHFSCLLPLLLPYRLPLLPVFGLSVSGLLPVQFPVPFSILSYCSRLACSVARFSSVRFVIRSSFSFSCSPNSLTARCWSSFRSRTSSSRCRCASRCCCAIMSISWDSSVAGSPPFVFGSDSPAFGFVVMVVLLPSAMVGFEQK